MGKAPGLQDYEKQEDYPITQKRQSAGHSQG